MKNKLKVKVLYRGKWYYAKDISIDKEGIIDVEYCHDLEGSVDSEHIEKIEIEREVTNGRSNY